MMLGSYKFSVVQQSMLLWAGHTVAAEHFSSSFVSTSTHIPNNDTPGTLNAYPLVVSTALCDGAGTAILAT
jgi:hypothetical protein